MAPTWLAPSEDATVASSLRRAAAELFGREPAGVWMAPGRVNLVGEHTDYNGGFCLPFALPHRTYAALAPRQDGRLRVGSRQREGGWQGRVEDVRAGSPPGWPAYVAGVLAALGQEVGADLPGVDVLVDGRVPLGAGLSSSAALSCSVAVALRDTLPALSRVDDAALVRACVRAENDFAGAATGGMDQTVSVRARDGHLLLVEARDFSLRPVAWTLPDHELLVVDTRAHHSLADGQYAVRRRTCETAAAALGRRWLSELDVDDLGDPTVRAALARVPDGLARTRHVVTENARTLGLVAALAVGDASGVGSTMTASHRSLRDDYEVSSPELDLAVEAALAAGAAGARMTGGGFGGSAIALVRRGGADAVAAGVGSAFERAGLPAPHFLRAVPSRPAGRVA